uniref:Uncharacterized protein n=1 Tax=Physcomitrium patens TaxID=3218 RepID=A0A2K1KEP2_PHYPA|nr:hypothetical protein PHYPA_008620 [Physcomitrium patens]
MLSTVAVAGTRHRSSLLSPVYCMLVSRHLLRSGAVSVLSDPICLHFQMLTLRGHSSL